VHSGKPVQFSRPIRAPVVPPRRQVVKEVKNASSETIPDGTTLQVTDNQVSQSMAELSLLLSKWK